MPAGKTMRSIAVLFILILAVPSFAEPLHQSKSTTTTSQTSLTPLTDKDYEKTCAVLAPRFGEAHAAHGEVLEILSSEIGQQIIKLALELEASNEAAFKNSPPSSQLISAKNKYDKIVEAPLKKQIRGRTYEFLGITMTMGLFLQSLHLQKFAEHSREILPVKHCLKLTCSGASGVGLFSLGAYNYYYPGSPTGAEEYGKQVQNLQNLFISDALLNSYAAYWSNILAATEKERMELKTKLEKALRLEVERAVEHSANEIGISWVDLADINILSLLRTYHIGSPEKINALQSLTSKLKDYRRHRCISEEIEDDFYDFASSQLRTLDLLIKELSGEQTASGHFNIPKTVNKRIVTEAIAKRDELRNTLQALSPSYEE